MKKQKNIYFSLTVCLLLVSAVFAFARGGQESGKKEDFVYETRGPQGEPPASYESITLTKADTEKLKAGNYKAAILMHTSADWTNAVIAGAEAQFKALGIKVVAVTDAEMDPNKQRTDIETTLALKPDIIITLVIDPVSGAVALRQAVDKGAKIVLISNLPSGFVHGKDYVGIVTDDLFQMGKATAEMIGDSLNDYPGIRIVTKKGIANPSDGDTIASAIITQFPNVQAIYAPWDTIAEGVVAGVRAAGRKDIGVFTMDLGANNAMDLVKGGNMKGMVADLPFVLGETLAKMGALSVLNKPTPAFVTVPAIKVDKTNIGTQWEKSLNRPLPRDVRSAM